MERRRPDVLRRFVSVAAGIGALGVLIMIAIPTVVSETRFYARMYESLNQLARVLVIIIPLTESLGVTGLLIAIGRSRGRVIGDERWIFAIVGLVFTAGAIGLWIFMKSILAGGMP